MVVLDKTCFFFHMLFSAVYVAAGSILIICGIYFLVEPPNFILSSSIYTGIYDLAFGIGIILMVSLAEVTWVKGLIIFYSVISVFVVNVLNLLLLELGEWSFLMSLDKMRELIKPEMEADVTNGRYSTDVTTGIVIIASFIHAQLTYWQVFILRKGDPDESDEDNDCVVREVLKKPDTICTSLTTPLSRYSQSWVFNPDHSADCLNQFSNLTFLSSDQLDPILNFYSEKQQYTSPPFVKVQVDETSEHYGDGDRQINHMKTFSRTPSPADASRSSSSISITPIYECLERLTQPSVYKTRLTSFKNLKDVPIPQVPKSRVTSGDKEHYASLMVELENSFIHKKEPKTALYAIPSSASKSSTIYSTSVCNDNFADTLDMLESRQRGSDAEFSKELEAALKLIQDLESPNTIDTPSETYKPITDKSRSKRRMGHEGKNGCDSSKTLSGCSSIDAHGKNHKTLPVESQSTSGYNSPSLDRSSRFTPTVEISSTDLTVNQENDLSCVIRYMGDTAVISLFSPSKPFTPSTSTEEVSYTNNYLNEADKVKVNDTRTKSLVELTMKNLEKDEKNAKAKIRRWRHFIERKRRPSLLPEVESAIIKSESLAFLSKSELKDRLNQTKNIHRQIEAKVHRQRSLRKADSFGSVEDLMDRHSVSPYL